MLPSLLFYSFSCLTVLPPLLFCDHSKKSSPDDDIGAYLESLAKVANSAGSESNALPDLLASSLASSLLPSAFSSSAPPPAPHLAGVCSADSQEECDAEQSVSGREGWPLLSAFHNPDYSQMRLDQLLEELITLTQKYPDQIESVIETYRQIINTID